MYHHVLFALHVPEMSSNVVRTVSELYYYNSDFFNMTCTCYL